MRLPRLSLHHWLVVLGAAPLAVASLFAVDPVLHKLCLRDTPRDRLALIESLPEARWTPPGAVERSHYGGVDSGVSSYERRLRLRGTEDDAARFFRRRLAARGWRVAYPEFNVYEKEVDGVDVEFQFGTHSEEGFKASLRVFDARLLC